MKACLHPLVLAFLPVLCACSTPAPAKPDALATASQAGHYQDNTVTGSRIPARRTEKMVGAVGGKDYQENKDSRPAPLRTE
jgi:hypothetical protein